MREQRGICASTVMNRVRKIIFRDAARSTRHVAVLSTLTTFLLPVTALATGPLLARALGVEGRGAMTAVIAPCLLTMTVIGLGLPMAVTYFSASDQPPPVAVLRTGLALTLGLGVLAIGVLLLARPLLLRKFPEEHRLFLLATLLLPPLMCIEILRAAAQARGRFGTSLAERATVTLVRLSLVVGLFVLGHLTLWTATTTAWAIGLVGGLLYLPLLREAVGPRSRPGPAGLSSVMLSYGVRSWLGSLAALVVLRIDQVLLGVLSSGRQLGLYAVAVSLAEVPNVAANGLREVVFATAVRRGDGTVVLSATRAVVLVSAVAATIGIVAAPVLLPLLFGADFHGAVPLAQVLFVASVPASVSTVAAVGLAAAGRPGLASAVQGVAVLATLLLLAALIPLLGALGAALASLGAYFIGGVLSVGALAHCTTTAYRDVVVPGRTDLALLMSVVRRRSASGPV